MSRDKVDLEHYIRKMIYNHITEYPGVSFQTLKKIYNLNDSTLRYHLKYLERAERINSNLEGGQLHYFPGYSINKISDTSKQIFTPQSLTQHQQHILTTIKQNPGISQKELGQRTSLKRFILTYNLTKLLDLGMIRKFNNGRNICYEFITNQLLKYEMLKVLAVKLLRNEIDENTFNKYRKQFNL